MSHNFTTGIEIFIFWWRLLRSLHHCLAASYFFITLLIPLKKKKIPYMLILCECQCVSFALILTYHHIYNTSVTHHLICSSSPIQTQFTRDKWLTRHLLNIPSTFWWLHLHAFHSLGLQSHSEVDTKWKWFLTAAHFGGHWPDVVTGSLLPQRGQMRRWLNYLMIMKN